MEKMQHAETLVKEFLVYRGFSSTLKAFEVELAADASHGFQVDRVIELLFSVYVPKFEADNLRTFMTSVRQSLLARSELHFSAALRKLESSLNRYYIVNAVQKGRIDRVLDFFEKYGDLLLQSGDDWGGWFAIPYMKHPSSDPRFHVYFTKEWLETLMASFGNFLSQVFDGIHLPRLLILHSETLKHRVLKQELDQLHEKCRQLQKALDSRDALSSKRPSSVSAHDKLDLQQLSDSLVNEPLVSGGRQKGTVGSQPNLEDLFSRTSSIKSHQRLLSKSYAATKHAFSADERSDCTEDLDFAPWQDNELFQLEPKDDSTQKSDAGFTAEFTASNFTEDKIFSEVAFESQETFSGHTSPITRCRFSSRGDNIASASVDGTVRIWAPDKHASTSNNATIYCGSEVLSLEWEYKSDRLLLLGTTGGAIRVWNVDGKRVVCNLLSNAAFPRVIDLKCSPTDPVFVSATASEGQPGQGIEALGFGSLTVWNMRHWKPVNVLPLGPDPPAVTSVCFNHNGKMVAAGATDGMIRLFDMSSHQPITGWSVLERSPVSCVRFGHDEASIWSLGSDGKLVEWSLHNQGQILQSIDAGSFSSSDASQLPRHEFALDGDGKRVLLTSNLSHALIYSLGGLAKTEKTAEQAGAITSVDWHPSQPVCATGSADHSVQVTMIR